MIQLTANVTGGAGANVARLVQSLGPAGRAELHAGAGASLWALVRGHLRAYALTHHATASRLGATPTGHLEQAAASVQHSSGADGATVSIHSPGIGRALRPLTIRPVKARALTIPIHALAYGKRVAELSRVHRIFRLAKTDVLAADIDGVVTPMYVLRQMVRIPRDRAILPSDDEQTRAVKAGYLGVIRGVVAKMQKGVA